MALPHIIVDADSCPSIIRKIIIKACNKNQLPLIFAANRTISAEGIQSDLFTMLISSPEKDSADNMIVELVQENDLVITRDIPLANRLVQKNITVMNDRGTLFTQENITERLSDRNWNLQLSQMGLIPAASRKNSFNKNDVYQFSNCFDRELQKKLRK